VSGPSSPISRALPRGTSGSTSRNAATSSSCSSGSRSSTTGPTRCATAVTWAAGVG